jgi:hypothetical protein
MINIDYHLLGDNNHHSHRRGNLKSYMINIIQLLASAAFTHEETVLDSDWNKTR